MSRKNLSRTVIEGGRYDGNKTDRYISNAEERARVRNYIQEVTLDPENYDEYDVEPREHVYKGFKDKLGPMYRWLQAQVGRPWDDVRSEVSQKFDTRTTAGRHIVYDHLLSSVQTTIDASYGRYSVPGDETESYSDHEYYVDSSGILCKKRYLGRRTGRGYEKIPEFDTKRIANWLGGRIVGRVGDKFFWFVPTGKGEKHGRRAHGDYVWRTVWDRNEPYRYYYGGHRGLRWQYLYHETIYKKDSVGQYLYSEELDQNGRHKLIPIGSQKIWKDGSKPFFRQGRQLNGKEMEFWNTLPAYYQTKVLEQSPNYPNPPKKDLYSSYYY